MSDITTFLQRLRAPQGVLGHEGYFQDWIEHPDEQGTVGNIEDRRVVDPTMTEYGNNGDVIAQRLFLRMRPVRGDLPQELAHLRGLSANQRVADAFASLPPTPDDRVYWGHRDIHRDHSFQ